MPVGALALIAACFDRAVTATAAIPPAGHGRPRLVARHPQESSGVPSMNDGGLAEPRAGGSVALWIETA